MDYGIHNPIIIHATGVRTVALLRACEPSHLECVINEFLEHGDHTHTSLNSKNVQGGSGLGMRLLHAFKMFFLITYCVFEGENVLSNTTARVIGYYQYIFLILCIDLHVCKYTDICKYIFFFM